MPSMDIQRELASYVRDLPDLQSTYTRFFDALLVKRPDHAAFFHDLRCFREQDAIIELLADPDSAGANAADLKIRYRETTRSFLASRFAHPWCRTTFGYVREGSSGAGLDKSGTSNSASGEQQREEDRMHRLLVPIWIAFRRRMLIVTSSHEELIAFLQNEQSTRDCKVQENAALLAQKMGDEFETADGKGPGQASAAKQVSAASDDTTASTGDSNAREHNAELYVMGDDDDADDGPTAQDHDDATAAAKLFVGVAATGWLASNKRARKYLLKKLNKPVR